VAEGTETGGPMPQSEKLRRLLAYWNARRGTRWAPRRADIDPMDFVYVLSHVALLDVLTDPWRFRYRVYGTGLVAMDGFDMTGRLIDDWPTPEFRALLQASHRDVAEARAPRLRVREAVIDGRLRVQEGLQLPLSEDGSTVSMILTAIQFREALPARDA
jgi:hypothetical protein